MPSTTLFAICSWSNVLTSSQEQPMPSWSISKAFTDCEELGINVVLEAQERRPLAKVYRLSDDFSASSFSSFITSRLTLFKSSPTGMSPTAALP
jgi:hypothetical protein